MSDLKISNPVIGGKVRGSDHWGSGHFGASRGSRVHNGLDIVARSKSFISSPIDGKVVRIAYPYKNDLSIKGVLIKGRGKHANMVVKMFYIEPLAKIAGANVSEGQTIGKVQSLQKKYLGITNHIHIEIKVNGVRKDPSKLIK